MGAVEDGDDDDPADVIHYREGCEEDAQALRHALSQRCQYCQGKGDVRRHGDRRTHALGLLVADGEEEEDGDDHPSEGGDDGQ